MSCPTTITGITTSCGSNMGGIVEAIIGNFGIATYTYTYQEDGQGNQILDADGNPIIASITAAAFNQGVTERFQSFGFRKNTGFMTTTLNTSDNGVNFWDTDCQLVFSKMEETKRLSVQSLMQGETQAVVKDANGRYWMLGLHNPLSMSEGEATTGTAATDLNGYTITLHDSDTIMPVPVAAGVVTTLTT